ncbi:MAG: T9SS type A sorting domain-containing protein [Chitinophagales bacterium]|nr:T9SS type A sorting domain-containing protein [Chitinophagaceae bacterium]MCB9065823.1 T9SS type A sorting domain-containing protein [Chitinophagales bacterium]
MQRLTAILFAMLVLQLTASAGENPGNLTTTAGAQVGDVFPHFSKSFGNGNAVEPGSRLIGKTYLKYSGSAFAPIDSAQYIYGGNRGGSPSIDNPNKDDHILFDHSYVFVYNKTLNTYENATHREQKFGMDNRVEWLAYQFWNIPTMNWKNKERYVYTYEADGRMQASTLQQWYATMWTNNVNSILFYDADNRVTNMKSVVYSVEFDYDANTKNLKHIIDKNWNTATQSWDNNERKSYQYNSKNAVTEFTLEVWNNSINGWVLVETWKFSYGSTGNLVSESEHLLWNGTTWTPNKRYKYAYQGGNETQNIEEVWSSAANGYVENKKIVRAYNTYNQPVIFRTYSWNGNTWVFTTGDEEIHYYYETYDPTFVSQFLASKPEMKVYPVPATSQVFVEFDMENKQDVNVYLTDMSGKIVYMTQDNAYGAYKKQIDVSNMPAGNYILSVNGALGTRMTERINVMH